MLSGRTHARRNRRQVCRALAHAKLSIAVLETLEDRRLLSATVTTNQSDYAPGSTAVITAASDGGPTNNFQAGETIDFHIERSDGIPISAPPAITDWLVTDGVSGFAPYQNGNGVWVYPDLDGVVNGSVETTWLVDPQFAGASLTVTATGPTKTYGTALSAGPSSANFTAVGAISGETVTSVTLTPDAAGLSATTVAGAAYVVTPSLATDTTPYAALLTAVSTANGAKQDTVLLTTTLSH